MLVSTNSIQSFFYKNSNYKLLKLKRNVFFRYRHWKYVFYPFLIIGQGLLIYGYEVLRNKRGNLDQFAGTYILDTVQDFYEQS